MAGNRAAAEERAISTHGSETAADLEIDDISDAQAFEKYETAIRKLLNDENFDQLDSIADKLRAEKTRFSGGVWKLKIFYSGLEQPAGEASVTDSEWNTHLAKLGRWVVAKPTSITARIALAEGTLAYGWSARGTGYADKVPADGWAIFEQETKLARRILQEASTLKAKCPEWYLAMERVARAEGWTKAEEAEMFERGVVFEPLYYNLYREHALYLLPKWYGEEGDAESMAIKSANRVGGVEGSIVYFEIAVELDRQCSCDGSSLNINWTLARQGFEAMQQRYGVSVIKMNQFCHMAVTLRHTDVAENMFKQIGDNWYEDSWKTRNHYEQTKAWAFRVGPAYREWQGAISAVAANLNTSEGRVYDQEIGKQFAEESSTSMKQCVDSATNDFRPFDLFLQLAKEGSVRQLLAVPRTRVSNCLDFSVRNTTFSPPPAPDYWVKISVNLKP